MTTYVPPKRATALVFPVSLPSQANSAIYQANPTLAAGDVKISKDGGAFANLTNLPTVTPAGGKRVEVSLTSTEMTADNVTVIFSDAAGAEWCDVAIHIATTVRQIDDLAYPATSGRSMVVDAAGLVDANMVKAGPTGSGTAQTARDIGGAVPAAAAGASGGLLISGSNSGTTTLAALTVTGATTLTGNVALADGLTVAAPSTLNRAGITVTGNGTGAGIISTGGATGDGIQAIGGASGHGLTAQGTGTTKHGVNAIGGATTSAGIKATGGATSGDGILVSAPTLGHGMSVTGAGASKHGGMFVSGTSSGNGLNIAGGSSSGAGILITTTSGDGIQVTPTAGHALTLTANGTTKHGINATGGATTSHGAVFTGGGVGHGILATSGSGATGDGIRATAASTNGNGMNLIAAGTGDGLLATGGASAGGDGIQATAGGGVDIRGAITGSVSGSVGSIGSGGITASSFATGAIDAAALASDAGTEIGTAVWATTVRVLTANTNLNDLNAAGVRSALGLASANLDTQLDALPTAAENATAVLTTQMTESYAADGVAPTLAQALFLIQQDATEFSISGTTRTIKKLDGSTTAATQTLNDATSPTGVTRAT